MRRRGLPTLRGRVSRLALGAIAAWLAILATGFDIVLISRLDKQVNEALQVRAQAASATVVTQGGRIVGVRESPTDAGLDSSIWVFAGSRAIEMPTRDPEVVRAAKVLARDASGYAERADHRFYVIPVRLDGKREGSVLASIDLDPYERTERTVILGSIVVTVLLLAGAYPVLQLATTRALRPVDRMTRQAAEWSVTSPGERFGDGQRYAELSSLAGTLDELLDRLAAVLRHERHLSAELSHELRTPIARVAAQVDLTLDDARPDQVAELRAIRDNCIQMDGIIDSLLAAARSEFARPVGRCELGPVFAMLTGQHERPTVLAEPVDQAVGVDQDVVVRILSPLLDNARRYAVSEIRLEAHRVAQGCASRSPTTGRGWIPSSPSRCSRPDSGPEPLTVTGARASALPSRAASPVLPTAT